jgi:hypothetical protein
VTSVFSSEVSSRFWSYVQKRSSSECWEWTGGKTKGYGMFRIPGPARIMRLAHRISFALFHGISLDDLPRIIRHECDNPGCVNPHHLIGGTHQENTNDMFDRGRQHDRKGERNGSAKLTEEDVLKIRLQLNEGQSANSIAKEFGVSHTLINGIKKGTLWKHALVAQW